MEAGGEKMALELVYEFRNEEPLELKYLNKQVTNVLAQSYAVANKSSYSANNGTKGVEMESIVASFFLIRIIIYCL